MGCMCCSLSSFVSIVLHSLERISLCTVCAMLTCCLLFTILSVLMLGIGIGYHYCFVQNSVDAMAKAAKAAGSMRSGPESGPANGGVLRSLDKVARRGFAHRVARRDAAPDPPFTNRNTTNHSSNKNFSTTNRRYDSQHRIAQREINHSPSLNNRNFDNFITNISENHRIVRREADSYPPLFIENTAESLNTNILPTNVTKFSPYSVTLREANPLPPLFDQNIDLSLNMSRFTDSIKGSIPPLSDQNSTIISFNKIISYMSNLTIFT